VKGNYNINFIKFLLDSNFLFLQKTSNFYLSHNVDIETLDYFYANKELKQFVKALYFVKKKKEIKY